MKKIIGFLCILFCLVITAQAQHYVIPKDYTPARATIVGDGFEMTKTVYVNLDIDSLYNYVDFKVISDFYTSDCIRFKVNYMTDSGHCLHLDKSSTLVIDETMLGNEYKLTIRDTSQDEYSKMVFLFYRYN